MNAKQYFDKRMEFYQIKCEKQNDFKKLQFEHHKKIKEYEIHKNVIEDRNSFLSTIINKMSNLSIENLKKLESFIVQSYNNRLSYIEFDIEEFNLRFQKELKEIEYNFEMKKIEIEEEKEKEKYEKKIENENETTKLIIDLEHEKEIERIKYNHSKKLKELAHKEILGKKNLEKELIIKYKDLESKHSNFIYNCEHF